MFQHSGKSVSFYFYRRKITRNSSLSLTDIRISKISFEHVVCDSFFLFFFFFLIYENFNLKRNKNSAIEVTNTLLNREKFRHEWHRFWINRIEIVKEASSSRWIDERFWLFLTEMNEFIATSGERKQTKNIWKSNRSTS